MVGKAVESISLEIGLDYLMNPTLIYLGLLVAEKFLLEEAFREMIEEFEMHNERILVKGQELMPMRFLMAMVERLLFGPTRVHSFMAR